jgi:hypothetical protein
LIVGPLGGQAAQFDEMNRHRKAKPNETQKFRIRVKKRAGEDMEPAKCSASEWARRIISCPRAFIFTSERKAEAKMPAKSKKQQMAAGAALSAKRGEQPKSSLKGASKQMVDSMSEKQLEDLAETKRRNLPEKKSD